MAELREACTSRNLKEPRDLITSATSDGTIDSQPESPVAIFANTSREQWDMIVEKRTVHFDGSATNPNET